MGLVANAQSSFGFGDAAHDVWRECAYLRLRVTELEKQLAEERSRHEHHARMLQQLSREMSKPPFAPIPDRGSSRSGP